MTDKSNVPSRPAGLTSGNRRQARAIEDLDRARQRVRRAARKTTALPVNATLSDVIQAVNELRRVLVE